MVELKRNPKTGVVESFRNGKKVGEIITMGDTTDGNDKRYQDNKSQRRSDQGKG